MTKFSKPKFIGFSLTLFLLTAFSSFAVYVFEYVYGNADGIWRDRDIVQSTYKLLIVEAGIILTVLGLFFSNKTISFTVFTILFSLFLIFCLEKTSLAIVNLQAKASSAPNPNSVLRQDHELSVEPDSVLGVKPKRNAHFVWVPRSQARTFDSVRISIDGLSRRITPDISNTKADKYALFLGCSYTYGDGVSDSETFPYYFQANAQGFKAYNMGYLSYSPLHALARLQHESPESHIKERNGVGVFTYINDHIDRVIPATRWIELTKGKFPFLNEANLQTEGLFCEQKRLYSDIVIEGQTSGIKQLFKLGYPKHHTLKHYELVIGILKKTEEEYVKRFKNNNFYVMIFPGNPMPAELKKLLIDSRMKYFDYSGLTTIEDKMLSFDDAHPAPALYEMVGRKLQKDIEALDHSL
jgi:hypothetical protein